MRLKDYLKENKLSITSIAKSANLPYSTVNGIVNGRVEIDKVQVGTALSIASACGVEFKDLYDMCKDNLYIPSFTDAEVVVKNKAYYLRIIVNGKKKDTYIFKVNPINTRFLRDAAKWTLDSIKDSMQIADMEADGWSVRSTI